MSEVMLSLKNALGEEARVEVYERVLKLHEKIVHSENMSAAGLSKIAFEIITLSILEGLRISIKQMSGLLNEEHSYKIEEYADRERFLNLITDLLKSGMITRHEIEMALKEPVESSLPWILSSLRDETEDLFSLLIIGYPGEIEEKVTKEELDYLLAMATECAG